MCSVLFLDIVGYSRKSVTEQISLRNRFNSYLSAAISDVPLEDRIILDTGDGAAIGFLSDVEAALNSALKFRESVLHDEPEVDQPMVLRIGINLGPVQLVSDINDQPNIVGDGINDAQRVMGFADATQIFVSRSYFDAVRRLSPRYTGMFHYQGLLTDKHVREHEVYSIVYPDESHQGNEMPVDSGQTESALNREMQHHSQIWRASVTKLGALIDPSIIHFRQVERKIQVLYVAVAIVSSLLIAGLINLTLHGEPALTGEPALKPKDKESTDNKAAISGENNDKESTNNKNMTSMPGKKFDTVISVACIEGSEVYVDGKRKGRVGFLPLSVTVTPGKHVVIVNHNSRVNSSQIEVSPGKTIHIKPSICN